MVAAPICITHTSADADGSTHKPPPEHGGGAPTVHARAVVPHVGGVVVATLVDGAHDPVATGAATVTAAATTGVQAAPAVRVVPAAVVQPGSSYNVSTGPAHVTLAAPQLQLEQVAAGATRSPWPSNTSVVPVGHIGGDPAPTVSTTGPIQFDGAPGAHVPPLPQVTITSAAIGASVAASPLVASRPPSPVGAPPPSPLPPV